MSSLASGKAVAGVRCDRPPLTVAQVGYTATDDDRDRWLAARIWLERNDPRFGQSLPESLGNASVQHDAIDLRGTPRRDFLTEKIRYDIVLTHNLWDSSGGSPGDAASPVACSPLHHPSAWRRRFEDSHARYIFMFGSDFNAAAIGASIHGYGSIFVPFRSPLHVFVRGGRGGLQPQPINYWHMANARLAALPSLLSNTTLDLGYADLRGEHLSYVKDMNNLAELRLVGTAVSDEDMEQVAQVAGLKTLNLDDTRISSAALRHLRKLKRLECLSLNHTSIDDEGLTQLRELRGLKWLSLIETDISDRGLSQLHTLIELEWLCLVNTKVTAAGVEEMRRATPHCTVRCNFP